MELPEIDRNEWLRGMDADERARSLVEWGLGGAPEPEIEELSHFAETGPGEWSWRLGPDRAPTKRNQVVYKQHLRCQRRKGPTPSPRRREVEELPPDRQTLQIGSVTFGVTDNYVSGFKSSSGANRVRTDHSVETNWVHDGLKRHFAKVAEAEARADKPLKPYANEPFVSKEQAAENTGNPFTDLISTRWSRLRFDEVARLYDAMAFARHVLQRRMNAHLTIRWSAIGVKEADAPEKLHEFLNRASRWFKQQKASRGCVWANTASLPDELLWVYVHEKSATYGFHTHVLLSMDVTQAKALAAWTDRCLAQLVYRETIHGNTTKLTRSYAKSEADQDSAHWRWFKYIAKQLDPDEEVESPFCDKVVQARQIFDPRHLRARLPLTVMRLVGICRRLDRAAQDAAGFVSRLPQGLMLYNDAEIRIPSLVEVCSRGCPVFDVSHGHERDYPGLDLSYLAPLGDRDVAGNAPHQYLAFETAWDRLTKAEQCWEAAKGGRDEAAASDALAEAQTNFEIAEGVINLDRWGLMPDVVYYEGSKRPKLRFLCSSAVWDKQLTQSNLKADAAYEWYRQYLQDGRFVDIVPREKMPTPKSGGRKARRGKKLDWRRPTGPSRV